MTAYEPCSKYSSVSLALPLRVHPLLTDHLCCCTSSKLFQTGVHVDMTANGYFHKKKYSNPIFFNSSWSRIVIKKIDKTYIM